MLAERLGELAAAKWLAIDKLLRDGAEEYKLGELARCRSNRDCELAFLLATPPLHAKDCSDLREGVAMLLELILSLPLARLCILPLTECVTCRELLPGGSLLRYNAELLDSRDLSRAGLERVEYKLSWKSGAPISNGGLVARGNGGLL